MVDLKGGNMSSQMRSDSIEEIIALTQSLQTALLNSKILDINTFLLRKLQIERFINHIDEENKKVSDYYFHGDNAQWIMDVSLDSLESKSDYEIEEDSLELNSLASGGNGGFSGIGGEKQEKEEPQDMEERPKSQLKSQGNKIFKDQKTKDESTDMKNESDEKRTLLEVLLEMDGVHYAEENTKGGMEERPKSQLKSQGNKIFKDQKTKDESTEMKNESNEKRSLLEVLLEMDGVHYAEENTKGGMEERPKSQLKSQGNEIFKDQKTKDESTEMKNESNEKRSLLEVLMETDGVHYAEESTKGGSTDIEMIKGNLFNTWEPQDPTNFSRWRELLTLVNADASREQDATNQEEPTKVLNLTSSSPKHGTDKQQSSITTDDLGEFSDCLEIGGAELNTTTLDEKPLGSAAKSESSESSTSSETSSSSDDSTENLCVFCRLTRFFNSLVSL